MRRATAVWIAGLVMVGTLLAACTSRTHGAASGGFQAATGVPGGVAAGGGAAVPAPAVANGTSKGSAAYDAASTVLPGPSVIRVADLTVSTGAVGSAADHARQIVTGAGGSVDGDDRTSGAQATATMTLRVPPEQLGAVLAQLSALGKEQSRHMSSRDVTTEVADVDSRVRSALAAISQLRDLYGKATRVSDIIEIESELAQREADLESLQAQQRALAGQVAMATVTLYLVRTPVAAHHQVTRTGFTGGLTNGWHAFTRGVAVIVTGVGAVLPFLVVAAIGGAGWWLARRRRPASTPPAPEPVS
ncbi:MAG TPA: DUF4349 domain-containing protein [Jatrophihabitantaceae bacterium]|nr:DUF4349 domain-containing protein [Jatrophihabitantaceae bacterium]